MSSTEPRAHAAEILAVEIETFREKLPDLLLTDLGKHALIKETELHGTWDTERDALDIGYRTFGKVPFLVRRIMSFERPVTITRSLVPPVE